MYVLCIISCTELMEGTEQGSNLPDFPSSRAKGQRSREDQTFLREDRFRTMSKQSEEVSQPLIQRQPWGDGLERTLEP